MVESIVFDDRLDEPTFYVYSWRCKLTTLYFYSRISNLVDLGDLGLKLNDLSMHGNGREMVMEGLQHNSRQFHLRANRAVYNFNEYIISDWRICTRELKSGRMSYRKPTNCSTNGKNEATSCSFQ